MTSVARSWQVLRKDLRVGPRSPVVLWALVIPVLLTLLIRGVFGDLFEGEPALGIVDEGSSTLTAQAHAIEGVVVDTVADAEILRDELAEGGYDAGLVLPAGFDEQVRAGAMPPLGLWVAGDSLPADRVVLTAAVLDLVRELAGSQVAVSVEVVELGEAGLPLDLRLLPLLVMYAVSIPGGMVPASSLVEEKERRTLEAVLAGPTSVREVLAAKGAFGVLLGVAAGVVTLLLNDAFGTEPLAVGLAIALGAVMMAQFGLMIGAWAPDTNTLFAAWKAGGIILFLPAIFFIWPDLPTWPLYVMPAYYFLEPAYAVSVEGATLGEVAGTLGVAAAICVVLLPAVILVGRWLERHVAIGKTERQATRPVEAATVEV